MVISKGHLILYQNLILTKTHHVHDYTLPLISMHHCLCIASLLHTIITTANQYKHYHSSTCFFFDYVLNFIYKPTKIFVRKTASIIKVLSCALCPEFSRTSKRFGLITPARSTPCGNQHFCDISSSCCLSNVVSSGLFLFQTLTVDVIAQIMYFI